MNGTGRNERADHAVATEMERLRGLLEQQLELLRQGSLAAAVSLGERADECVRVIVEARALHGPGSTGPWRRIESLYRELCLTLTAQREETSAVLNAVRRGKRILKTYGNHPS
jgi:hypothetical protein